jgi:PHD/YefM family antitoxin component YafN of YafNO toxin-antitoxin module
MSLPDTTTYSEFRENLAGHFKRLRKSRQPTVIIQNGKTAAVVMSPAAYERLLADAEEARTIEAIRQAQKEIRDGKGRPAAEVFAELKAKYAARSRRK